MESNELAPLLAGPSKGLRHINSLRTTIPKIPIPTATPLYGGSKQSYNPNEKQRTARRENKRVRRRLPCRKSRSSVYPSVSPQTRTYMRFGMALRGSLLDECRPVLRGFVHLGCRRHLSATHKGTSGSHRSNRRGHHPFVSWIV